MRCVYCTQELTGHFVYQVCRVLALGLQFNLSSCLFREYMYILPFAKLKMAFCELKSRERLF